MAKRQNHSGEHYYHVQGAPTCHTPGACLGNRASGGTVWRRVGSVNMSIPHAGDRERPLLIELGSPWEKGYIESFNGKLRDEPVDRELLHTVKEAQILIECWRQHDKTTRPPSALGYRRPVPAARAVPTPTPLACAALALGTGLNYHYTRTTP